MSFEKLKLISCQKGKDGHENSPELLDQVKKNANMKTHRSSLFGLNQQWTYVFILS